jgi:hypothetical protein
MAVGAQEPQVRKLVVLVVTVAVIEFERQSRPAPFGDAAHRAPVLKQVTSE